MVGDTRREMVPMGCTGNRFTTSNWAIDHLKFLGTARYSTATHQLRVRSDLGPLVTVVFMLVTLRARWNSFNKYLVMIIRRGICEYMSIIICHVISCYRNPTYGS